MATLTRAIVVADANVLINLMHVSRLDLCEKLPDHNFVVPDHVREEILLPTQAATLDDAAARGVLRIESITDLSAIALFAELRTRLGRGEAACLSLAITNGWMVASDEKRRFRREAEARLGKESILGTVDIFVMAIRAGVITVDEADAGRATLQMCRFRMEFESFGELVRTPTVRPSGGSKS